MRDTIRRVRLAAPTADLLNSVISSIIVKGEETRSIRVESFILRDARRSSVDISDFFSRHHLPKLRHLDLSGFSISSWDLLRSRTTSLTTLSLTSGEPSPLPTLSQMLSILSANPSLQSFRLSRGSFPDIDGDGSSSQVQLPHLKALYLANSPRRVFGLSNWLGLPDKMDDLNLTLTEYPPSDLLQTLRPYLGDNIRRRSPDGLSLLVFPTMNYCSILVGRACEDDLARATGFMIVGWATSATLGGEEANKFRFDIIGGIPQGEAIEITTTLSILCSEHPHVQMCNLTLLHLKHADLFRLFVEPVVRDSHAFRDLLRRHRSITITKPRLNGGDWGPLTNFLLRRAAVGNRVYSLSLRCYPHMNECVAESVRRTVGFFEEYGSY